MGSLAKQTFNINGNWVAPAGVTQVTVVTTQASLPSIFQTSTSTLALNSYGVAYGWGSNTNGQLGTNSQTAVSSPNLVVGGLTFSQIIASPSATSVYGVATNGQLYAWGSNANGQLGVGDVNSRSSPTLVLGGLNFSSVYVDDNFSGVSVYAIASNGVGYAWGLNTSSKLGIGNSTDQSSPVAIVGSHSWYKFFSDNNDDYVLGLDSSGTLWSWGSNGSGQLGDGTITTRSTPVQVLGGLKFKQITNFESGTVAITDAGVAYGWGNNQSGNLGVGDITSRSSPVQVVGGLTFSKIVGGATMWGLTTAGAAYGWGVNGSGQIGDGTVASRSSPTAVLGGLTFVDICSLVTTSAYALTAAGALYAWGDNANGHLGVGDITPRSSPVAVLGGLVFSAAPSPSASIQSMICANTTTGQLYAWGVNGSGQLGDGTIVKKSSPVLVVGGFVPKFAPQTTTTIISVTPGTTYAVNMQQINPVFGTIQLANFIPSNVTVYFEE